jgi:DNA-binding CsgD family transcriptional regulator
MVGRRFSRWPEAVSGGAGDAVSYQWRVHIGAPLWWEIECAEYSGEGMRGPGCRVAAGPGEGEGSMAEEEHVHEAVYEYAVEHPDWTEDSAALFLGLPLADIQRARDLLLERFLLQPARSGHLVAVSPDLAASALVNQDEEQIRNLTESVRAVKLEFARLRPLFVEARTRSAGSAGDIEVVEDPEVIVRVIRNATRDCRTRAFILRPSLALRAESYQISATYDRDLVERGVLRRNIMHLRALESAAARRSVQEMSPLGVQFRTLTSVPLQALLYDSDLAVLSREGFPGDRAALVIREPALVQLAFTLYESLWELATPCASEAAPADSKPGKEGGPTREQSEILAGLAAGATDEVIARRLGVHIRTYRRHLLALGETLGAETRFQIALSARNAGWV